MHQHFHRLQYKWYKQFFETVSSWNDDDRREVLLDCCREGEKDLNQLGAWWKDQALLQPLLPSLWSLWDDAITEYIDEQKNRIYSPTGAAPRSMRAHTRVYNLLRLVGEGAGVPGQLRLVKSALRLGAKAFVWQWEDYLLKNLGQLPLSGSLEDWMAWKLDESVDEALNHLSTRIPKWPQSYREPAYSQLAIAFYRRYTDDTRQRFYEVTRLAEVPSKNLFEVLAVHRDEEAWLRLLCGASQKSELFFDFWKLSRVEFERPNEVLTSVLTALSGAVTESGAVMLLQMLHEVEASEFIHHVQLIARSVESPHHQVAKWALETLQKMPNVEADWLLLIDNAGEKLWGDNVGLAKVAARFLGITPTEHLTSSWGKLEEALALENLTLVEVIVRAMGQLKRKDTTLHLEDEARERLAMLAQMAPERFSRAFVRLQGP